MPDTTPSDPVGETDRRPPVPSLPPDGEGEVRPFVGRSRGRITADREDLVAPVGEDWEVNTDL